MTGEPDREKKLMLPGNGPRCRQLLIGAEVASRRDTGMSAIVQGFGCRPCRRSQVHGGRRPKAAKERTRDGGTCVVPHAWSYVGLERQCNLEMMARMLLNGDFMFCAAFDFNELRVAKIAHSTTLAR